MTIAFNAFLQIEFQVFLKQCRSTAGVVAYKFLTHGKRYHYVRLNNMDFPLNSSEFGHIAFT